MDDQSQFFRRKAIPIPTRPIPRTDEIIESGAFIVAGIAAGAAGFESGIFEVSATVMDG